MLNLWNLKGPLNPPLGRNFGISDFPLHFYGNRNQHTEFHVTMTPGSALDHISSGIKGPWLHPWVEILDFQIFSYSFRETVISIPIFMLLREMFYTILRPLSGAPCSTPGQKFTVLFLGFCSKPYHCEKFQLPRPS